MGPTALPLTTHTVTRGTFPLLLSLADTPETGVDDVTVTSVTGDSTALPCHVTGNPAPSYTWRNDSQEVTVGGVFAIASNGTLFIAAVSKSLEGQFVCMGSNALGAATSNVTLRVLGEWAGAPHLPHAGLSLSCAYMFL